MQARLELNRIPKHNIDIIESSTQLPLGVHDKPWKVLLQLAPRFWIPQWSERSANLIEFMRVRGFGSQIQAARPRFAISGER
jgi:hypothetical protein